MTDGGPGFPVRRRRFPPKEKGRERAGRMNVDHFANTETRIGGNAGGSRPDDTTRAGRDIGPHDPMVGRHAWIRFTNAKMVLNKVWIPNKENVMFNSLDVLDDLVPVSELSNGRTAAVLSKADHAPVIIIKRNKPSYVLMGIDDYQCLLDRLEDMEDVRLAEKRIEDNDGRPAITNADLMAGLGLTEEDIAAAPTPEMA